MRAKPGRHATPVELGTAAAAPAAAHVKSGEHAIPARLGMSVCYSALLQAARTHQCVRASLVVTSIQCLCME